MSPAANRKPTDLIRGLGLVAKPRMRRSIFDYLALYAERRALGRLDDLALRDLGLTREEADAEASRPVWDVPQTWRQ